MEGLLLLRNRVEALVHAYAALKDELRAKDRALHAKNEEVAMLQEQLRKTEERLLAIEIGKAIPDAESRAASRRQLDNVIGEIDKILISLHD